jgi:hypothetical protein
MYYTESYEPEKSSSLVDKCWEQVYESGRDEIVASLAQQNDQNDIIYKETNKNFEKLTTRFNELKTQVYLTYKQSKEQ